jgi:hypothetical protein
VRGEVLILVSRMVAGSQPPQYGCAGTIAAKGIGKRRSALKMGRVLRAGGMSSHQPFRQRISYRDNFRLILVRSNNPPDFQYESFQVIGWIVLGPVPLDKAYTSVGLDLGFSSHTRDAGVFAASITFMGS